MDNSRSSDRFARLQKLRNALRLWLALCLGVYLGWSFSYFWPIDEVAGGLKTRVLQVIFLGTGALPLAILELIVLIRKCRQDVADVRARHRDDA